MTTRPCCTSISNDMHDPDCPVGRRELSMMMEKNNLINLVQEHRDKCDRACDISLCLIRKLAERAGIKFTDEEKKLFM